MGYIVYGVAGWVVLMGLWILLTFQVSAPELVAGAATAAITIATAIVGYSWADARFDFPPGWAGAVSKLPLKIITDSGLVGITLFRRFMGEDNEGGIIQIPFDPGTGTPQDAARTAVVIEGISVTPNTIAITVDCDGKCILAHQLTPTVEPPERRDPRWPI